MGESLAVGLDDFGGSFGKELVRRSLSDRIWMFSFAAGLITVMAHGFKWI